MGFTHLVQEEEMFWIQENSFFFCLLLVNHGLSRLRVGWVLSLLDGEKRTFLSHSGAGGGWGGGSL